MKFEINNYGNEAQKRSPFVGAHVLAPPARPLNDDIISLLFASLLGIWCISTSIWSSYSAIRYLPPLLTTRYFLVLAILAYGHTLLAFCRESSCYTVESTVMGCSLSSVASYFLSFLLFVIGGQLPSPAQAKLVGFNVADVFAGYFFFSTVTVPHSMTCQYFWLIEQELQFPFMALLISGGHNLLILARELGNIYNLGPL